MPRTRSRLPVFKQVAPPEYLTDRQMAERGLRPTRRCPDALLSYDLRPEVQRRGLCRLFHEDHTEPDVDTAVDVDVFSTRRTVAVNSKTNLFLKSSLLTMTSTTTSPPPASSGSKNSYASDVNIDVNISVSHDVEGEKRACVHYALHE